MPGYVLNDGFELTGGAEGGRLVKLSTGSAITLPPRTYETVAFFCGVPHPRVPGWAPLGPEKIQPILDRLVSLGAICARIAPGGGIADTPHLAGRPPMLLPVAPPVPKVAVSLPPPTFTSPWDNPPPALTCPGEEPAPAVASPAQDEPAPPEPPPSPPESTGPSAPLPREALPTLGGDWLSALLPDDAVPQFKPELRLKKRPKGGVYDVEDPVTGKAFALYDFEVSVARMLNGQRRISEVLEAGVRLGIPVELDALRKFLRELHSYGFLNAPGSAAAEVRPAEGTIAQPRRAWDEGIRTLFQSGIRMIRLGRNAEATSYFEALLELDPENEEALELIALIQDREARGSLPQAPVVERLDGYQTGILQVKTGAEQVRPEMLRPRFGLLRLGVASAAAAGAIAVAFLLLAPLLRSGPPPQTQAEPVPLAALQPPQATAPTAVPEPEPEPEPEAPGAGPTAAAEKEAEPLGPEPVWRSAQVKRVWQPAVAEVRSPRAGTLQWTHSRNEAVVVTQRVAVVHSKRQPDEGIAVIQKRIAELEKLAKKDALYDEFLQTERARLAARMKALGSTVPILSAADGLLQPSTRSRRWVRQGQLVGQIIDRGTWHISAVLPEGHATTGSLCILSDDSSGQKTRCEVVEVAGRSAAEITASVPAERAGWLSGALPEKMRLAIADP